MTLVLQVFHGHIWSTQAETAVVAASKCVNQWAAFCMARQASRWDMIMVTNTNTVIYTNLILRISSK